MKFLNCVLLFTLTLLVSCNSSKNLVDSSSTIKNLIYGSAKSALLTYLSGLRQKYNQRLTVVSVIPGYIRTKNFKIKAPNFLICEPSHLARKIVKAIKYKHEIIYSSFAWKIIMMVIKFIPEKIFKKFNF